MPRRLGSRRAGEVFPRQAVPKQQPRQKQAHLNSTTPCPRLLERHTGTRNTRFSLNPNTRFMFAIRAQSTRYHLNAGWRSLRPRSSKHIDTHVYGTSDTGRDSNNHSPRLWSRRRSGQSLRTGCGRTRRTTPAGPSCKRPPCPRAVTPSTLPAPRTCWRDGAFFFCGVSEEAFSTTTTMTSR